MGNIKGAKRGKYNKTKNKTNEKTIIKNDSAKIAAKKRSFNEVVERVKNNVVNEDADSVDITKGMVNSDNSGNDKTENFSSQSPSSETQNAFFQETSGEEKLNSFFDEYKQVDENENVTTETKTENKNDYSTPQNTISKNNDLKILINGYMLLAMCDVVFPVAIRFIFGMFNKRAKQVPLNKMKLEPEQREALMASADQVAAYIFERANPLVIFVIAMGMFYGTNFQTALSEIKENEK